MEEDDGRAIGVSSLSCSNIGIAGLPATPDPITLGPEMTVPRMEHVRKRVVVLRSTEESITAFGRLGWAMWGLA